VVSCSGVGRLDALAVCSEDRARLRGSGEGAEAVQSPRVELGGGAGDQMQILVAEHEPGGRLYAAGDRTDQPWVEALA
jgi:hypothetical protein